MSLYDDFKAGPSTRPSPGETSPAPKTGIVGKVKQFFHLENDNPITPPAPTKATGSLYEQFKGSEATQIPFTPAVASVAPAPAQPVSVPSLRPGIQPTTDVFATKEVFTPSVPAIQSAPGLTKNPIVAKVTGGTTLSQFVKDAAASLPEASQKVSGWLENVLVEKPAEALGKTKFIQEAAAGIEEQKKEGKKNLGVQVLHKLQYGQEAISGLTGGIITPKTEAPEDIADKIASGMAFALGQIVSIRGIGTGLASITGGEKVLESLQKFPLVYKYGVPFLKNAAAFGVYGQLDPMLADDVTARTQKMGMDFLTAAPFTALGYVNKAGISIPASFALGWGMAKLGGASNEDAFVSGVVLGGIDAAGRVGGRGRAFVTGRYTDRALKNEAADVLNQYNEGKPLTPRSSPAEIERVWKKAAFATHPDLGGDPKAFVAANSAYQFLTGKTDTFVNTKGEPVQKTKTGETKLLESADKVREQIQTSEAFDVKRALASRDLSKESVYQNESKGILTPEFAQGRIEDVALKLESFQPGLGEQFRASINPNETSIEAIKQAGETALDIAIQTKVPGYTDPSVYLPRVTPGIATPASPTATETAGTTPASNQQQPPLETAPAAPQEVSVPVQPVQPDQPAVAPAASQTASPAVPQVRPIPKTSDEAVQTYYNEVLKPAIESGKAVVIGADDLKDFFNKDYLPENHSTYSTASFKLYERMLEEVKNPTVKFTVGGTGSGKSDFVVKNEVENFDGIVYDSTGWNYDGIKKQIEAAQLAGKDVRVFGIIPDVGRARAYTFIREARGEHPVSESSFVRTHVGAIQTMLKLIEDGVPVYVLDARNSLWRGNDVKNGGYQLDPVDLLKEVAYSEEYVKRSISGITAENAKAHIERRTSEILASESGGEKGLRKLSQKHNRGNQPEVETGIVPEEVAKQTSGNIAARGGKSGIPTELVSLAKDNPSLLKLAQEAIAKGMSAEEFVKERGNPLYHGTNSTFTDFDPKTIGNRDSGWFGSGFYFTQSKGEASTYGKNIMEVYLDIENPFDFSKYNAPKPFHGSSIEPSFSLAKMAKDVPIIGEKLYVEMVSEPASQSNDYVATFKDVPVSEYSRMVAEENLSRYADNVFIEERNGQGVHLYHYKKLNGEDGVFRFYGTEKEIIPNELLDFALFDQKYSVDTGAGGLYGVEKKISDNIGHDFTQSLKKLGYDGTIQSPEGDEYVAFYPKQIKTKSQLVDFYNKVKAGTSRVQNNAPLQLVSMNTFEAIKNTASEKMVSPRYTLEEGAFEKDGKVYKYSISGGKVGITPQYTNSLEELAKMAGVDKTNTAISKTDVASLYKSDASFRERPVLTVEERHGSKFLTFKSDKTDFKIRASALGLKEANLKVGDQIEVDPKNFKNAAKEMRVTQGGKTYASMDKFADVASGSTEAGIEKVKRIELPELVQLARDLMGDYPKIEYPRGRAMFGGARPYGLFIADLNGKIILNPDIFKKDNEGQAAKTLAHELGHLIDYLPNRTLARGNLLGRLASLRDFRKDFYAEAGVSRTNNAIKRELWELSKLWKPIPDEENSLPAYLEYRKKPEELYADFISVIFNDPALAAEHAPEAYNTFFKLLDRKPKVAEAYFELQTLLKDGETALKNRKNKVQQMFSDADMKASERQRLAELEADVKKKSLWFRFKWDFVDRGEAVSEMVEKAKKEGRPVNDDDNPVYYLEESRYLGGKIKAVVDEKFNSIYQELQEKNLTWNDLGELLFYERILKGDRGEVANPEGLQAEFVQDLYEDIGTVGEQGDPKLSVSMKSSLGAEKFAALQDMAVRYRKAIKEVFVEGYNAGLYSNDLLDLINSNDFYVPFKPIKYAGEKSRFGVKKQKGTFQPIENPANTGIEKTVAIIRAIERNKTSRAVIQFVQSNFPAEVEDAKTMYTGKATIPLDPREAGKKLVTYMEGGKVRGFYVDEYIAESLIRSSVGHNNLALEGLRFFNGGLFRPLFITFNLGFQSTNFIRDFKRYWKNTPDATIASTFSRYLNSQVWNAAKARAFGLPEGASEGLKNGADLILRMEKEQVLSTTYNDILKGQDPEELQIEKILRDLDVMERPDRKWEKIPVIREAVKVLEFIEKLGNFVESLPKVAGFVELEGKMPPREMHSFVRKYIGSPDFLAGGRLKPYTNEIFLFSNAIAQGIRADWDIAIKNPKTRSGWWWKTAQADILPKLLMAMAVAGLFGEKLKQLFDNVSEYDKTNYAILPLGLDQNGKTIYVRIPADESGRLVGGIIWKAFNVVRGKTDPFNDVMQVISYTGGQLPSLSPVLGAVSATAQFVSGQNPYDYFRGRNVLSDQEYRAGGAQASQKFAFWMFEELGGGIFVKPYSNSLTPPKDKTTTERILSMPVLSNIFNRFLKVSDYGQTELIRDVLNREKTSEAREQLARNEVVEKYVSKAFGKTPAQQHQLALKMVEEALGHKPANPDERKTANTLTDKFEKLVLRGKADPRVNALLSATSNDQKAALVDTYQKQMDSADFAELKTFLIKNRVVSPAVFTKVRNLQQSE